MSWSVNKNSSYCCIKCGQNKPSEEYSWSNMSKGLKNSVCNECRRTPRKRKSLEERKVEFRIDKWQRDQWTKKDTAISSASR